MTRYKNVKLNAFQKDIKSRFEPIEDDLFFIILERIRLYRVRIWNDRGFSTIVQKSDSMRDEKIFSKNVASDF